MESAAIPFKGEVASDWLPTVLSWIVPVVLFFLLWNYLFKKMGAGGGMMQIGKSKAKVYIEKKPASLSKMLKESTKRKKSL